MTQIGDAAFALLKAHRNGTAQLTRAAGSFCGELMTDPRPLTEKQASWLAKLLERAGLPTPEAGESA